MSFLSFKLNEEFFQEYVDKPVPWGYVDASGSAVSEIVFLRTYSRIKEDGRKETWPEVCRRVVEGTYSIQKDYAKSNRLPWNDNKAQKSAQEAFDRMFNFKWTPPGRGLWSMGTALVNRDRNSAALQNCAFVSTADMTRNNPAEPFCWLMEASMLGVGVGFDTKGADKEIFVQRPVESNEVYQIPDTREGWVESTRLLINAHLVEGRGLPGFDYSDIRPAGEPIKTFGGTAAGPEPLMKLHEKLTALFRAKEGQVLDTLLIMDIANLIGVCVVSGNVRRCMPQGTLVHTSRGLIPIESVRVGDEVLTSGAPSKVLANMNQGVQKTNVVRTEIGQLEATPNHRVATVKNIHGDLEWKRVDELYPGDKLVFPRKVTPGRETQLPSFTYVKPKRSTTCVDITIPELDVEMAWFLGLFLGDGYVYPNFKNNGANAYVSVACDPDNRELIDRAVTQLERFGVKATPKEGFKGDRCVKIVSTSKQLAWYFSKFKTANETIFVPDFIREGCPEIRAAFLAGILDSDGALNNKPVVACSSVYPEFVKGLQDLYASLGIPTVMKLHRPAKGPWKNLYHLNLKGSHPMEDFSRYVLPHSSKKLTRERTAKEQYYYGFNREMVLRDLRYKDFRGIWIPKSERMTVTAAARILNREVEWYPIEVVSIEGGRTVPTYDIEVQDEHNFIAHGYVVHNSAELAVGTLGDKDFLLAKNYEAAPYRADWGWMSNNSVEVNVGDDLSEIVDGIALNGEPGVIWMDTTRQYGRLADPPNNKDRRVAGYNPCAEQSLESYEMCVSGDTRIQTEEGLYKIRDVVGQTVRVWNGEEWAEVTPFSTGVNELYRVTFSDGSYLDATPGHEWSVKTPTGRKFQKLKTKDLSVGMVLPEFNLDNPDGKYNENAYTYGWVAGDGYIDGGRVMALVKADEYSVLDTLGGTVYKEQSFNNDSEVRYSRVNVSDTVPFDAAVAMRREDRLPEEVFTWDAESVSDFMGGWIDADGSLIQNPNTDHYVLYGSEGKLREAQILLRRIGVNHASLRLFSEKGTQTNKGVRNQDLYRLLIPSYEADRINTRVKVATRFRDRNRANNAHPDGNQIDSARKQKIVSIEKVSDAADTYCFNEPKRGMGVFGNVLTYQCTLVETYIGRHESVEDYRRTLKFAYLYAKTVTLLPTHWEKTNAIMQRNRRIGTSMSGIANYADNHGMPALREMMDKGYEAIKHYDRKYSEWLCVRESIKTTTVKPSGTVSLLAGESPGVHWAPGGKYHLRGVVFSKDDPMVDQFRQAGYEIHESAYTPETSVFIQFPIESKAQRSEKDVTIFEKINLAAVAQEYWSDNAVSVTVSFDAKGEARHVPTALAMYEGKLKTVSFLPQGNDTYPQMPYQEIEANEYEELAGTTLAVDLGPVYAGNALDAEGERYCTTDKCEIPKR